MVDECQNEETFQSIICELDASIASLFFLSLGLRNVRCMLAVCYRVINLRIKQSGSHHSSSSYPECSVTDEQWGRGLQMYSERGVFHLYLEQ